MPTFFRERPGTMARKAEDENITTPDDEPDEEDLEEAEEADEEPPPTEEVESSLDELLAKREKSESEAAEDTPAEEEVIPATSTGREDRVETLSVKVVPQQPTEFTCRNCFLVKHRSQLANKRKMLCRDCA